MYLLIRYPADIIVEAVALAKGRNRMRVAVAGFPETLELKRSGEQWFTETRQPVEFEFVMADACTGEIDSPSEHVRVSSAAGSAAPH